MLRQSLLGVILARLQTSSISEVLYRIRCMIVRETVKWSYCFKGNRLTPPGVSMAHLETISLPEVVGHIAPDTMDQLLEGHTYPFPSPNPSIGILHPKDPVDIRSLWEPARLQHITALLKARHQPEFSDRISSIENAAKGKLFGWLRENPFPFGIHYSCAMECGLRVAVLLRALLELPNLDASDRRTLLQALFEHGWLIRNRLSLFNSLGNHTVAESVGLIMAGRVFSESRAGRDWLKTGIGLLEQECEHQIVADGGPAEQSLNYHRMVLDLYWLAVQFLEMNWIHDCGQMKPRLLAGESFLQAVGDPLPSIGDSDDGYAVAPGLYPLRQDPVEDLGKPHAGCTTFPETGMTIAHLPGDIRLTFHHGPLGMPPLYNHGHADALSITLYRSKRPFLVDPGTYRYNDSPIFRAYFKGTSAHNTVSIDGEDQARQVTGFIWDKSFSVEALSEYRSEKGIRLSASHNGYMRLSEPVRHARLVFIPDNGRGLVVQDKFPGKGTHRFEINYHLHPEVEVAGPNETGWYTLTNDGEQIFVKLCQTDLRVICGRAEPLLGWYSSAYGVVEKTNVLHGCFFGPAEQAHFTTLISFTDPGHLEELLEQAEYAW